MGNPAVTAPIIGARNLAQLEASLAALEFTLSEEERAAITALTPAPPPPMTVWKSRVEAPAHRRSD